MTGAPPLPGAALQDRFGRTVDYLRLSLTDRCDLRCRYCLPAGFKGFEPSSAWLSPAEIERVVAAFAAAGVRRVRLTGGEPLTRRDVVDIAARIAALPGIDDLSLTTNGTRLEQLASPLRRAGVRRLNVSVDSLHPERFASITGRAALPRVLAGLDAARNEGFAPIKVNMVSLAGINEDEAEAMVEYCIERDFVLRLIEPMPVGAGGRAASPGNLTAIRRSLQARFDLVDGVVPGGGPARYLRSRDGRFSLGFITPLSQHFCATCNRVRLSADGKVFACLGNDASLDLKPIVRAGAHGAALEEAIRRAIRLKPERHEFDTAPGRIVRPMAATGG